MSKRFGGIIGCKDNKTSTWHLNGFPYVCSKIDCVNNSILLSGSERRAAASIEAKRRKRNISPLLCGMLRRSSGCVCVFSAFSSHLFWTPSSLDVPAGVTQEEGHTGFLIHLLSAVRALVFLARRIQPFLSLVDREVEFCVLITI